MAPETTTRHAPCLIRRIAWRIQANELGGLSERARQRALDLADEAELRMTAPNPAPLIKAGRTSCLSKKTRSMSFTASGWVTPIWKDRTPGLRL